MLKRLFLFLAAGLLLVASFPTATFAGTQNDAKVALHLQPYSAKAVCLPASEGGQSPDLTPCSQFVPTGLTGTGYNAYLVVAEGYIPGLAGLSCGIQYEDAPQTGVDVFNWVNCADLEFPNAGPNGVWPAAGGGNRITFDYTLNCQNDFVPGYENEGYTAVFGSFYVYAYDSDVLAVTQNLNLESGPELVVGDCNGSETNLLKSSAGFVAFSANGSIAGCNPCLEPCVLEAFCSVQPSLLLFGTVWLDTYQDRSFVLSNQGPATLTGNIVSDSDEFTLIAGGGPFSLASGASLTVTVRCEPATAGDKSATIYLGGACADVRCSAYTPPRCSVSPTSLAFGSVLLGSYDERSFTVTNGAADTLVLELTAPCLEFAVRDSLGPFVLAQGESRTITVRFTPAASHTSTCTIDTGDLCTDVVCTGTGIPPTPVCWVDPPALDFDQVLVGLWRDLSFRISNQGGGILEGDVSLDCPDFQILSGGGPFSLYTQQFRTVTVRFAPTTLGPRKCTIGISGDCTVAAGGTGSTLPGGQEGAVITVHAATHTFKGDPCTTAPTTPCSEYVNRWPLLETADIYLMVCRGDPEVGVGAISCGIRYDNGALGGSTMHNSSGVDVFNWTLCTSGLEFPNGSTGLDADEWPASGGGNRITWNTTTDCQTTVYGSEGVHALAGVFYVYAYSDDRFEITPNPNLRTGPEFQVGDCNNHAVDLMFPQGAGQCAFGLAESYNPCLAAVPVRLLSFTAERVEAGAEVRWVVAGADADHLGFNVYRGLSDDDRVEVSAGLLTGRESYIFVDDDPPSTAVSYWLAERSRAGETTWHGPVELAAAAMPRPGLLLRHASPNPFLSATRIAFRTGAEGAVSVRIYDTAGREVARPFSGRLPAGEHEIAWDGRDASGQRASAGIYFYRVESDQGGGSGKVVLIR